MAAIDFSGVRVLTFDCYGTLIDWETGLLAALARALPSAAVSDGELLEEYAGYEAALEAGPWRLYREVLTTSMSALCAAHGIAATPEQQAEFGGAVADWPAFPDSASALARLRRRFDLGVITNCDDDLFAYSNQRLGDPFRWVVTAQQAHSYKPSINNFELAFERIGRPRDEIVHVAQSLYHDHVPAKSLGLRTVWINRRHDRPGTGNTPQAAALPDLTFPDMASFAEAALDN